MKILLVTEYFYPQSSGGTELYVYNLAASLQNLQHEVIVLSLFAGNKKADNYKGITILYIPFNQDFRTEVINGNEPADNIESFINVVSEVNPNVIHFHTLTTSIGADHVQAAKRAGFKTIFTSHIAAHTCVRGTLMQMGKFLCDGKVEEQKCLSCYLQLQNVPQHFCSPAAFILRIAQFPKNLAQVVKYKQNELQKLLISVDQLVVVSNWQHDVFTKNGFNFQKANVCRQAIEVDNFKKKTPKKNNKKLVLGFIGRVSSIKGLHVLLNSLKHIKVEDLDLRIAAIEVHSEKKYFQQQKQQAEGFPQVKWTENLPNRLIANFLQELDILCVPSQLPETGPFVVYEALAQGIPVLGSNLGGIAELISEGENGWLFPFNDDKYLASQIALFIKQKLAGALLKNVAPIERPIETLAGEMLSLYQTL